MRHLELPRTGLEQTCSIDLSSVNHALWVCFLNLDGFETFADATYNEGRIKVARPANVPKDAEVSTVQFWVGQDRVTAIPTGLNDIGQLLYQTVETIVDTGEVPVYAVASLTRRLKKQPYRDHPASAIYPLLQLPPFK